MEQNLSCGIVEDLLPSYADGLTGPESNRAVQAHLALCQRCREKLAAMGDPAPPVQQLHQVDYLKKVRRRSWGRTIGAVVLVSLLILAGVWAKLFWIGSEASPESVYAQAMVTGNRVEIRGGTSSSALAFSRFCWEEQDGVITLRPRLALVGLWKSGTFRESYTARENVEQVKLGDLVLWDQGVKIDLRAAQVFNAAHPYVGDMSKNNKLLQAMRVYGDFGEMTHELQAAREPYGWTLCLEKPMGSALKVELARAYSLVLLACVENLGQVTWRCDTWELTITEEEATEILGADIKEFGATAAGVQTLLDRVQRVQAMLDAG